MPSIVPGGVAPAEEIDGFILGERIHSSAMGNIYRVDRPDKSMPMIMKLPRIGADQPAESLLGFETESIILPVLSGSHVPRFVAGGEIGKIPYLVTEWIAGESLQSVIDAGRVSAERAARIGAAIADAIHDLHQQDTIHLDLKPDNVILKSDDAAVLIDFGLAHHARFPDLLAEEKRFASGSAPYISPEQVLGTRMDSRSDLFALGVVLYEMVTGELPFGSPETVAGLRDRLWIDPAPPRQHAKDIPPWLQEVILRSIEPNADDRYQSAAHLAFDLRNPEQVALTARANKAARVGILGQILRWRRARNARPNLLGKPLTPAATTPVIMAAVDTNHPDDPRQLALQRATLRALSVTPEYRLICVSVVDTAQVKEGAGFDTNTSGAHLEHLVRLRHWVAPMHLPAQRLSLHVIESRSPESVLIDFARRNHVDIILIGAPSATQQSLAWWRSVASSVTANANCTVHVVRVPEFGDMNGRTVQGTRSDA